MQQDGIWKYTYRSNRLLQLLLLARLHRRVTRPIHQARQFLLVALDPTFQVGDIIPGISISAIEHVPHAHEGIPLLLEILEHALVPDAGFVVEQGLRGGEVLGGGGDALVEEGHVVGVGGVGRGAEFREVGEGVREAEVVEGDALVAFDEPLEQRAQVDVGFCGLADAGADRVERFEEVGGEGVFEVGWEAAAGEFLLDGGRDLFAEAGQFGGDGEEHFDEFFLSQDRMAD